MHCILIQMLEFDSVRPPRPESSYLSLFQVRVQGLGLEKAGEVFALEQLTGPDPSSAPDTPSHFPRVTNHANTHTSRWTSTRCTSDSMTFHDIILGYAHSTPACSS